MKPTKLSNIDVVIQPKNNRFTHAYVCKQTFVTKFKRSYNSPFSALLCSVRNIRYHPPSEGWDSFLSYEYKLLDSAKKAAVIKSALKTAGEVAQSIPSVHPAEFVAASNFGTPGLGRKRFGRLIPPAVT
jgi:hypothetical protein